jgi:AraC-like DNA-binding protein
VLASSSSRISRVEGSVVAGAAVSEVLAHRLAQSYPGVCWNFFSFASDLRRFIKHHGLDLALVEPRDVHRDPLEPVIQEIRRANHLIPIVVAVWSEHDYFEWLVPLIRAGADSIALMGSPRGKSRIEDAISRARLIRVSSKVMERVGRAIPESLHPLIYHLLELESQIPRVNSVARAIHLHRSTLAERCSRAGIMPPRDIVAWCRLLRTVYVLEHSQSSIEKIAVMNGFGSGSALHNALRKRVGLRATGLRNDGFRHVLESFADRLQVKSVANRGQRRGKYASVERNGKPALAR